MFNKYTFALFLAVSLAGCDLDSSSDKKNEVFIGSTEAVPELCDIIPDPITDLFGAYVFCPKPMSSDDPNYDNLYNYSFVNYTKQFGTAYTFKVEVVHLDDPLQDASSVELYVLEVLAEQQDPLGTVYIYHDIPLYTEVFLAGMPEYDAEDVYRIGFRRFHCAEDVDCDTLVELSESNSGGLVSVEITLTGGEIPGTITAWY